MNRRLSKKDAKKIVTMVRAETDDFVKRFQESRAKVIQFPMPACPHTVSMFGKCVACGVKTNHLIPFLGRSAS